VAVSLWQRSANAIRLDLIALDFDTTDAMNLLQRSVLRQLLTVFVISLTAVTLLMISVLIILAVRKQGLGYEQMFQVLPYVLPDALRFSVPATILFSVCSVYGRLASANEVVAIKSVGISPWAIVWPTLVCVALISYVAVWLNDLAVSWGYDGLRKVVMQSIEPVTYSVLRSQKTHTTDNFTINVRDVVDDRLIEPTMTFKAGPNSPEFMIRAEWAKLKADVEAETLTLWFHNGHATGGDMKGRFGGTIKREIPLSQGSKQGSRSQSPSHVSLREIPGQIVAQKKQIQSTEENLATQAATAMLAGDIQALGESSWDRGRSQLEGDRKRLHHLKTEPHRRWANGFSCLCFVFIGCPLALRMRNAEFWTVFFMCFLPILLVYYPLLTVSVGQAKVGDMPPIAVWLGNVIMIIWGLWTLRKVIRY